MSEQQQSRLDEQKRKENLKVLEDEAVSREKRIEMRRERRLKSEAALRIRRRKRMFKVAGAWIGAIFAVFFIATWFSTDFVNWLHGLTR